MSLGVDDYLEWTPTELASAADWLHEQSGVIDDSAKAIRNAADRGTEGQSGQFITRLQDDAARAAGRIDQLADMLLEASEVVGRSGAALDSAVRRLQEVENALLAEGFVRVEGEQLSDIRTAYADSAERRGRKARAAEFREQIWDLLQEIREVDEKANRDLHFIVDRDVRDRTALGNGDPVAVFQAGGGFMAFLGAVMSGAASQADEAWRTAVTESWRGASGTTPFMARGLGPAAAALGFLGAVANRPEDEPLHEAIVAEGVGVVAGAVGAPIGLALGTGFGGPVGGATAYVGGSVAAGMYASHWVREGFDRAN